MQHGDIKSGDELSIKNYQLAGITIKVMRDFIFRRLENSDIPFLLNIFNYYTLHTTSDFSDKPHDLAGIQSIIDIKSPLPKYVIVKEEKIIGFGLAYPFRTETTFAETVKFTYWIKPSFTRKGLGTKLYNILEEDCRQNGILNILVNISSENPGSIKFHERQGFVQCGYNGHLWRYFLYLLSKWTFVELFIFS